MSEVIRICDDPETWNRKFHRILAVLEVLRETQKQCHQTIMRSRSEDPGIMAEALRVSEVELEAGIRAALRQFGRSYEVK
jgi:hypothetical protein